MFNPMAAAAVKRCLDFIEPGAVLEFGNQRFRAGEGKPGQTTRGWYESLGFSRYLAVDVNQRMDAVAMDLNRSFRGHYGFRERFDLVTNNGTGEHIFNQAMVFENAHDCCRPGGLMLHVLPMLPWLNHGFFNYTPVLFRDLAAANGYRWAFLWIGDRWGKREEIAPELYPAIFEERRPKVLRALIDRKDWGGDLMIVAALIKHRDDVPFRYPIQGKYRGNIEDARIEKDYAA